MAISFGTTKRALGWHQTLSEKALDICLGGRGAERVRVLRIAAEARIDATLNPT